MKNILIPTCYHADTVHAIEKALLIGGNEPFEVILLSVAPMPDSIMDFILANEKIQMTDFLQNKMEEFRANFPIVIRVHHQYGASHAVLQQVVQKFEISLVIIPPSFKNSNEFVEQEALKALHKMNLKIVAVSQVAAKEPAYTDYLLQKDIKFEN